MSSVFDEPWDPDAPLLERLIARGAAIAVLAGMIVAWARLLWLWASGRIKTEPFFGSMAWNLAIVIPMVAILATWWIITQARGRKREQHISALMPVEPLSGWHNRIRALDAGLERGTPPNAVDMKTWELTLAIVSAYPQLEATQREHVRLLWRTYGNFGLYASVTNRMDDKDDKAAQPPLTVEEVRRELILHSMRDQFPDERDAAVDLSELSRAAVADGIDFSALAREVADLSDDTRRDGMFGSTRAVLLRYVV